MYIFYVTVGGRQVYTLLCSSNPTLSLQSCLVSVNQHAMISHPNPHMGQGIIALCFHIRCCTVWILYISQLPNLTHACRHFNKSVNCIEYFFLCSKYWVLQLPAPQHYNEIFLVLQWQIVSFFLSALAVCSSWNKSMAKCWKNWWHIWR